MRRHPPRSTSGQTLLELIMATSIVAATLVPALALLRDGMALSRDIDRRNLLANYGVSTLEGQLAIVAASWSTGSVAGDYAVDGHPHIRFVVGRSDALSDGGIPGRLMNIVATAYDDQDQNDVLGTAEPRVVFRSKIARLATYTYEAGS